jgi:hypothetical protein
MDALLLAPARLALSSVEAAWPALLRHPFGGFHVESQAIPTFILGAVFGASGWLLVDSLSERRTKTVVADGAREPGVAASGTHAPADWRRAAALPLRLVILLLGLLLADSILNYGQDVATMAAFAPPSDLDLVARLIDVYAILAVAGAVLAVLAPRAAAAAFAAAAVLGAALALANLWQTPLGLDRTALVMAFGAPWQDMLGWAVLAAALAFLAALAYRRLSGRSVFAGLGRRAAADPRATAAATAGRVTQPAKARAGRR